MRRRILELLADREMTSGSVCEVITAEFGISQPGVSQHLKVLRENGFATVRPEGTRRLYAVNSEPLRDVDEWIGRFRRFWAPRLDALETELARGKRERRLGRRTERVRADDMDVTHEINAVRRQVGRREFKAGEARVVTVSRTYGTSLDDLWDACTNPSAFRAGSCRSPESSASAGVFSSRATRAAPSSAAIRRRASSRRGSTAVR